uniref:Uncharacterized protein n=1 Tax=mine drainage metagenome TaxID=410659 RepID=E6QG27_9ZZZZ
MSVDPYPTVVMALVYSKAVTLLPKLDLRLDN